MKMQLTLYDFDTKRLDAMKENISKFAECSFVVASEGDGGETVFVTCNADMVKCMEVVAIADLYWGGEHSYDLRHD